MAIICEKDFALHVDPAVSLIDYWDFDDLGAPFLSKVDPGNNSFNLDSGAPVGGVAGILNTSVGISGVGVGATESLRTAANNPLINPENGFTWTTWVNFADYGTVGTSISLIFEIHFLNSLSVEVINFRALMGGIPPVFMNIQKNNSTFFTPTASFGTGLWNFIQIQFDATSNKFGFQRGHPIFGLSGLTESTAIADDLSSITQGYLILKAERGAGISPDYRQDESGFWGRLLTAAEVIQLFGGGTPPAYPAIPQ
jgi:hypothetical protein